MSKISTYYRDIKINIQRWQFRRKYKSGEKVDLEKQLQAIEKATALAKKRNCKLWVIRVFPGKYRIYSKGDVKQVFRNLGIKNQVDMYQLSDVVVYITK